MPFKKGQVANPLGRPKIESSMAGILRRVGDEKEKGVAKLEIMLRKIYEMAMGGDLNACNFVADRTDGKAIARIEQVGEDMLPEINIHVVPGLDPNAKRASEDTDP